MKNAWIVRVTFLIRVLMMDRKHSDFESFNKISKQTENVATHQVTYRCGILWSRRQLALRSIQLEKTFRPAWLYGSSHQGYLPKLRDVTNPKFRWNCRLHPLCPQTRCMSWSISSKSVTKLKVVLYFKISQN